MDPSLPLAASHARDLVRSWLLKIDQIFGDNISPNTRSAATSYSNFNACVSVAVQSTVLHAGSWIRRHTSSFAPPLWILPSFVTNSFNHKPRLKPSPGSKISALDGLRGLCCLMVMHMHWAFALTDSNENGSWETNVKYLFHRPFCYLLWAGTSHVNVFFVLSGYVLSVKCLNMIHQGVPVHRLISSAVFRRATRIFLPPIAIMFIYLVAIRLHVFHNAVAIRERNAWSQEYQLRFFENCPPIYPTFSQQFWDVLGATQKLLDPSTHFELPEYGKYDTHLWTMPTEFYCSLALFLVLLATCQLWTRYRILLHGLLVACCWLTSHQNHGLFFFGLLIAEFDILLKERLRPPQELPSTVILSENTIEHWSSPQSRIPNGMRPYFTISNIISATSCLLGLYLLSIPLLWAEETPGFRGFFHYMPAYMNYGQQADALRALGAALTVWPITFTSTISGDPSSTPIINFILCNPVSAYLGQISFAFYLIHGFVIRSLGYSILPLLYNVVIGTGERRLELSPIEYTNGQIYAAQSKLTAGEVGTIWFLGYLIVLPTCIWMADLFHRFIDLKCVALGRALEEKMVKKDEPATSLPAAAGRVS